MVDSLVPQVEKAAGLQFQKPPRFELRSKAQVQQYLKAKLDQEFPAGKVQGITAVYSLLDLIPDTLDLKGLLLPLYSEQVVGYYDPDSTALYAVDGATGEALRLVLAHELVHALQHEQLPLERMLKNQTNADRVAASQAVLEGHATVAMIGVMMPDRAILTDSSFWQQYRETVKSSQSSMPVFNRAPLILREGLIFPYLGGAEFIRWWEANNPSPFPPRDRLPQSTEQILHPDRYRDGDRPVVVQFADSGADLLHDDTMGELELSVWAAEMRGGGEVLGDRALGWGGDRVRAYRTPDGPALVLYTVWDDSTAARRFAAGPVARFRSHRRPGYRTQVDQLLVDGRFAVRIVRAPTGWASWPHLPAARIGATMAESPR